MMEKMMSDNYNYNDLLKQFKMIKRMGSLSKILGFIPVLGVIIATILAGAFVTLFYYKGLGLLYAEA